MSQPEHDTETLLRDSFERLAERAPGGREVRTALVRARQSRRRRSRLALAAVAAAVVVVTVGVSVVVGSVPDEKVPAAAGRPVLGYSPGWLPDGFTEQYRSAGPGTTPQVRRWFAGPSRIELSAFSTADPDWSATALRIAALPAQIVVHGRVAMVTGSSTSAVLTWSPDDTHVLRAEVDAVPAAREVAQRIAEDVTTDEPHRIHGEARFGPLPDGLREAATTVSGATPADGTTTLEARNSTSSVQATVGPASPGLGGSVPVTIRGGSGAARADLVTARLPSGRWLTVSGKLPRADLVAVADGVVLDPDPDYDWLGQA
ncbi:hypothetical protein [Amycolatopsis sp. FDAARGOS 1241]|uniref:hypothetical protein n=1 Tax=Amycolatopsis sp. FDAARGOS 1241 TaxID=2778070 RepID=UPI00194FA002|nr:hypothetical protein [Amycolatopsis sp. FDAARGOS 1241]QRP44165.1 hypothetical protein I6J71_33435 [Amycolatopsis sp. FDAARGOS 1241]